MFVSVNVFSGDPIFQIQPSTGAVLNTLNTSNGSPAGGLCFDAAGLLYAADSSGRVSQFDSLGNLVNPTFINIPNYSFSSCLVDTAQHVWVTVAGVTNAPNAPNLLEYDGAGRSLATFNLAIEFGAVDSIALASDQCTLFYTSGNNSLQRFNVCSNTQLPDFATGLNGSCNGEQVLPGGGMLASCSSQVYLLNADGSIARSYPEATYGGSGGFANLALAPDKNSFWVEDSLGVYHIDIVTGKLLASFSFQAIFGSAGLPVGGGTFAPGGLAVFTGAAITSNRPIIFLHGINQNANVAGVPQTDSSQDQFVPLYQALNSVYGGPNFQTFSYVDDRALAAAQGGCPPALYPPCQSQSAILDNAEKLAQQIDDLFTQTLHKVTLIGYSMGAAIIRTALAGCPEDPSDTICAQVPKLVDNVFFINGVQQGSWLLRVKQGIDAAGALPAEYGQIANLMAQYLYNLIQIKMGLNANYPAEGDLTPGSTNIKAHNSVPPPTGVNYFNFYGDIQLQLVSHIAPFFVTLSPKTPFGDLVLLRGDDNPQATPYWGGARFCLGCGNQAQFTSLNSYAEWPLTDVRQLDLFHVVRDLGNAAAAPEMHTNIYSDTSLGGGIQVPDLQNPTGVTTSIAYQILLDLEREDGLI